jgi:hypothetical protein
MGGGFNVYQLTCNIIILQIIIDHVFWLVSVSENCPHAAAVDALRVCVCVCLCVCVCVCVHMYVYIQYLHFVQCSPRDATSI